MTSVNVTVTAGDATANAAFTVTTPVTAVARFVGAVCSPPGACPSSVTAWLASPFGAHNQANKQFYSGTQGMSTWQAGHLKTDQEALLPKSALSIICYGAAQIPSLPKYVASIPVDQAEVWLVYDQESENDPSGDYKTFLANSQKASKAIRAVGHPNVKVVQDSAGSKYGVTGSTAQQGLWVVPPEFVDIYAVDCYQNQAAGQWPTQGLANYGEFQEWLAIYAKQGRPLAINEYGVSACNGAAARNARILQDAKYLRTAFNGSPQAVSPFPLAAWLYWYSDCQAGQLMADCRHQHQFSDSITIATWTAICNGTF